MTSSKGSAGTNGVGLSRVLTAYIPDVQFKPIFMDALNIEALGGHDTAQRERIYDYSSGSSSNDERAGLTE